MLRTLICKQRYKILQLTIAIPLKYYNRQGLLHSNANEEIPLFAYCYYFSNCMFSLFAMIYLKGEFIIFSALRQISIVEVALQYSRFIIVPFIWTLKRSALCPGQYMKVRTS